MLAPQQRGEREQRHREPRRQPVDQIVTARAGPAEARIALVLVADHGVERRDRLDQDQSGQTEQTERPQRREHAIGQVLRETFERGAHHAIALERFGITSHQQRQPPAHGRQIVEITQDTPALFQQLAGAEQAVGDEQIPAEGQPGMDGVESETDAEPDPERRPDHQPPVDHASESTIESQREQRALADEYPVADEPDRMQPVDGIADEGIEQAGAEDQDQMFSHACSICARSPGPRPAPPAVRA